MTRSRNSATPLPHQHGKACWPALRQIKARYERNHVIVEFQGSSAFLNSDEVAEAKTSPATPRSA